MKTESNFIPLEALRVAQPCRADWNAMCGDERARYCQSCEKHVYNLSGMSRVDAEQLVRSYEGEMCIRLSRRADGTVITDDCPVGWRRARNASRYAGRIVIGPVCWTFSKVLMLLAPLLLVGGTMWAKSERAKACGAWTQSVASRLGFGRRVQTVFGMSNRALTTGGDMLNMPSVDMLSGENTTSEMGEREIVRPKPKPPQSTVQ